MVCNLCNTAVNSMLQRPLSYERHSLFQHIKLTLPEFVSFATEDQIESTDSMAIFRVMLNIVGEWERSNCLALSGVDRYTCIYHWNKRMINVREGCGYRQTAALSTKNINYIAAYGVRSVYYVKNCNRHCLTCALDARL